MKKRIFVVFMLCKLLCIVFCQNETVHTRNTPAGAHYVYFDGFDFQKYNPSTCHALEVMLEIEYEKIAAEFKNQNFNFVFVGHSQGGLRALAMSTYLRSRDPELYRRLKGVITLSGIDNGIKLLEGRGSVVRAKAFEDAYIMIAGINAVLSVPDVLVANPDIITNNLFQIGLNAGLTGTAYGVAELILIQNFGATSEFLRPILTNENWDYYAQVRDMCPESDFIKKYIRDEYGLKLDPNLQYHFEIGAISDTLNLIETTTGNGWGEARTLIESLKNTFYSAHVAHIVKTTLGIGLFTNSIQHSINAYNAYDWFNNYQAQLNDLIGSPTNDGFVAAESQYILGLPNITINYRYNKNHANIIDNDIKAYYESLINQWVNY